MKVKLDDVARLAGVGIATVDRVLNERGGVSPQTAKRVIDAARRLGLRRVLPKPFRRSVRFEILLARRDGAFFSRLAEAFEQVVATLERNIVVQRTFVDERRPERIAEHIRRSKADALVVYGQEDAAIIDAVAAATSAGVPVVAVVSDLPTSPRLAYVGIDHYSAGRAAAFFMAKFVGANDPVIVLCSNLRYRAHSERIGGFRDGLRDYAPHSRIAAILEGRDDETLSLDLVSGAFAAFPACAGIYNTGAANRAVARALRLRGATPPMHFIGHDLSAEVVDLIASGIMTLAIDQNPRRQAQTAMDILLARFGLEEDREPASPIVPFTIHVRDNTSPATWKTSGGDDDG